MSRVKLLPRLDPASAQLLLEEIADQQEMALPPDDAYIARGFSLARYAATGGSRSEDIVRKLAEDLRAVARRYGDMREGAHRPRHALYDRAATRVLALNPALRSGEALRDDVWTFISVVLLPDVVAWRFPKPSMARYCGGVRNTFQRLWIRGVNLDRGSDHEERWGLVTALTEDAMVQIFERASILASPGLSRAIAEVWVKVATREGRHLMENITRTALKMIRIRNEIVDLAMLDEGELKAEIQELFDRSCRQHRIFAEKDGF